MGKIVRKRKEFGGSSNSAENIMYDETKNVKGAIDETKNEVSELNSSLTANDNLTFNFSTDGEGNYGYLGADGSFIPFKGTPKEIYIVASKTNVIGEGYILKQDGTSISAIYTSPYSVYGDYLQSGDGSSTYWLGRCTILKSGYYASISSNSNTFEYSYHEKGDVLYHPSDSVLWVVIAL